MSSRDSAKEKSKGNVLVSVRVRPDSGKSSADAARSDGEWYVDGRQSVVSYRGKDGGDYYYGELTETPFFYMNEI